MAKQPISKAAVSAKNAGMVLLNNYIPYLFERLGVVSGGSFTDEEAQLNAVHYLQYVITGQSYTAGSFLMLNKVLCSLPLSHPVPEGILVLDKQKQLVESMINAMISHWPAIGASSVEGFRGNWLVRDGLLSEHDDKWELIVHHRSYDILLHQSPFMFSLIKYPWMAKPLQVTWPY
ncbi:contractile injection system tape measure protein [Mucilaginibacter sp. AW1-3]